MATMNPFDLLLDNDNDDPSQLIEAASAQFQKNAAAAAAAAAAAESAPAKKGPQEKKGGGAKLPTKPLPPSQAVREARNESGRGGGRGSGRGGGRGRGGGYNRDYSNNENAFSNSGAPAPQGDGEAGRVSERRAYGGPHGPYRGGHRGGFSNEEGRDGDRPRRTYERHSGTGRGNEFKREGAGRGNWGNETDEVAPVAEEVPEETENNVNAENPPATDEIVDGNKEAQPAETEEKEPEAKEMTLEEYEKVLEEKRKELLALKTEERKVEVDKDLQSMQQLSNKKKDEEPVFIKLGSDKDKKKEASEREKVKKSVSINEFLKPADGERFYNPGGRGRGRGRGPRGGGGSGYGGGNRMGNASAPIIEDQKQFPTLGGAPRA